MKQKYLSQNELDLLSDQLLAKIRRRPGHKYDIKRLISILKTNIDDLKRAVKLLRNYGYKIRLSRDIKISYIASPDLMLADEIKYGLKTKLFGHDIHAFESLQSTNTTARKYARKGAPEGTLIVSEKQTRGRGRLGRKWHSPEGAGLYISLLVKPVKNQKNLSAISLVAALAAADTISGYIKDRVGIKWPNDIIVNNKKMAGVLSELFATPSKGNYIVIGIGLNINNSRLDIPEDLRSIMTSLRLSVGRKVSRISLLQQLLYNLEKVYSRFRKSGFGSLRKRILSYSVLQDKEISIKIGQKSISGRVLDIDSSGHLIIETQAGQRRFSAGEVTLHK